MSDSTMPPDDIVETPPLPSEDAVREPDLLDEPAETAPETPIATPAKKPINWQALTIEILLVVVLLFGGYLRFVGLNWDDYSHLHPDERFLTMVQTGMRPVDSLGDYFDTENSTLNPHNVGYRFFVYGTVPMFITRYAAAGVDAVRAWRASENPALVSLAKVLVGQEGAPGPLFWFGSGYDQVHLLGRFLSASFDLAALVVVYLLGSTLYDRRVGLLAAALSAVTVAYLQQAHFFTVDAMANFFVVLSLYFAAKAARGDLRDGRVPLVYFALFGVAYGLAVASRVNTFPLALTLVLAGVIMLYRYGVSMALAQRIFLALALGGVISILTFRIGQPYAFTGPNFWNVLPAEQWLDNMGSIQAQMGGDLDFPPNHQWTDRPAYIFPLRNLLGYGMGWALGLAACAGVIWALWRSFRGPKHEWLVHLIPLVWTLVYFGWLGGQWVKPIRYFLPIYPSLIVLGAALLIWLWDASRKHDRRAILQPLAGVLVASVVIGAGLWGWAFTQIYVRPLTRVAATDWIFQNLPASINMVIDTADGEQYRQPFSAGRSYESMIFFNDNRVIESFVAGESGVVSELMIPYLGDPLNDPDPETFYVALGSDNSGETYQSLGRITRDLSNNHGDPVFQFRLTMDPPFYLQQGITYYVTMWSEDSGLVDLRGSLELSVRRIDNTVGYQIINLSGESDMILVDNIAKIVSFTPNVDGTLSAIVFGWVSDPLNDPEPETIRVAVSNHSEGIDPLTTGTYTGDLSTHTVDPRGTPVTIYFDPPLEVEAGQQYFLSSWIENSGAVRINGSIFINETSWDDGLPLRRGGYDPFGGLYRGLTLELYDNDDVIKRQRMIDILNTGDYIIISSNRQTDSLSRLPTRYPMTMRYYEALFSGELGFELMAEFISDPNVGPWVMPDQTAEEPFTVYDHPRVLIFQKTEDYDPERTSAILNSVDLSAVIWMNPYQATQAPSGLMLPDALLAAQQSGGTWSELFNTGSPLNQVEALGVLAWWLLVFALGLLAFPILFTALPGLADRGYGLARTAGLLLVAWGLWLPASLRILPSTGWALWLVAAIWFVLALGLAYAQRESLLQWWREQRGAVLQVEIVGLVLFALFLYIRWQNPDLWHPSYGGEKPMDFAYFNAVLKSTYFPPYDPWLAGGYINYYYFGFVLAAVPTKMLGIVPAVSYNLMLVTVYAITGMGAFTVAYNLFAASDPRRERRRLALLAGVAATLMAMVLGNLAQPDVIADALKRMTGDVRPWVDVPILRDIQYMAVGLWRVISGTQVPIGTGQWYWNATRLIPTPPTDTQPITEFPFFTFLYADLHAHMLALPLTLLCMAWAVNTALAGGKGLRQPLWREGIGLLLGGLAIGALAPTNTWDFPTYLILALVALGFAQWMTHRRWSLDLLIGFGWRAAVLVGLTQLLYQPFSQWYGQGYNEVKLWEGSTTGLGAYLKIHGLFLIILVPYLLSETRRWMQQTTLDEMRAYANEIRWATLTVLATLLAVVFGLVIAFEAYVALIALPLMVWAGLLMIWPQQTPPRRAVLALMGLGLTLTLAVELVVLEGDIGRMNTVFKFYLQVWLLFSVAAGAALAWVWQQSEQWHTLSRDIWVGVVGLLVVVAALYPLTAAPAKMSDRFAPDAPATLNGLTYMQYAEYADQGQPVPLAEDYAAIRWLQENVEGSPVIVELNTGEYRWGSRISINTGLPAVVGWNWHQRQQRAIVSGDMIYRRVDDVRNFYSSPDMGYALDFLERYDVTYIMAGVYEQVFYGPQTNAGIDGLEKFERLVENGILSVAFQDGDTRIYKVDRQALAAALASLNDFAR